MTETPALLGKLVGVIRGPINAEKIARVPGTKWVITSGMESPSVPYGRLYLVDTTDLSCQEVYPHRVENKRDATVYGQGPDSLDPLGFQPHGLDVLARQDGGYSVYVVNHGTRESVEVFDLDLDAPQPTLSWLGGVVLPKGNWPNDVAPLEDGGFIVSSTADPDTDGLAGGMARMFEGIPSNGAVEWHPGSGAVEVPGSQMAGANGIVASLDGRTVFIGGWRNKDVVRLRRAGDDVTVDVVQLDILVDNLTWTADGLGVLATGAYDTEPSDIFACFSTKDSCWFPCKVVRVDAETLATSEVVVYDTDVWGLGTTALEVGDEVWVSSARASGIARFQTS